MTTRYITETKWRVQLQTGAPTLQTFEKVLDAPSDRIAIYRAQQMYPNLQFISVNATQVDPSGTPSPQQNSNTPNGAGMQPGFRPIQPLRGLRPLWPQSAQQQPVAAEAALPFNPRWFNYPYSITLPASYSRLLKETAPVPVISQFGQHSVILETETEMKKFLVNLTKHRDQQTVSAILAGIRSSMA